MALRRELIAFGLLTACAALYLLVSIRSDDGAELSADMAASNKHAASTDDLEVSLSEGESKNPSSIKVTIANKNSKHPLTFLKWDSPFDPTSLNSGVFKIHDLAKDEELPNPGLRVSRMLPPSREDLIEVPPQSSISEQLELKAPWIPADGRKIKMQAEGNWKAVWPKSKTEVGDEELQAMASGDVLKGSFRSEGVLEFAL